MIPSRELVRVVPIGELDLATISVLDQTLGEQLAAGFSCLVLDLSRLTFLDSTGINAIVRYQQRLEADGRQFRLIPGPSQVQRPLKVMGLVDRLPFSNNEGTADRFAR